MHGADGTRLRDGYRLITTLLDWRCRPAGDLVRLYHGRGEIEVTYLALRHTLPGGYVLRSRDQAGAEQELWALLTVCQALRMAMTTAAGTVSGTGPDRASFTVALETAREQVITARGITGDPADPGGTGRIGRAVLAALLPARRARYSARKVKCSTSRYNPRELDRPELPTRITRVLVTSTVPPPDRPAALPRGRKEQPSGPAVMLGIKSRNMLTQLAGWTRLGFLTKTGQGRHALPGPISRAGHSLGKSIIPARPAPFDTGHCT